MDHGAIRKTTKPRIVATVFVFDFLYFFVKIEAEPVLAFVAHRKIRKDEVTSFSRSIQIDHASDCRASENWWFLLILRHTATTDMARLLECGE